jgi:hypothetical protein
MNSPRARQSLEIRELKVESGTPALNKAEHRAASRERYQSLPLSERLLEAVAMVGRGARGNRKR